MPKKAFVICYCRLCGDSTFQVVRELADSVFGLIGFRIRRFSIAHLNEKSKLLFHNYLYKEPRCLEYDEITLKASEYIQYGYDQPKAPLMERQKAYMACNHISESKYVVELSWEFDGDEKVFFRLVNVICGHIRKLFILDYVVADQLDAKKSVGEFASGILTDTRTSFENQIAFNNQLAAFSDNKLPFLYAYTVTPDGREHYFPQLLSEELEAYCHNSEWKQLYEKGIAEGVILPVRRIYV